MTTQIAVAAIAYVAGAFTPAVGRKIKSFFVTEAAHLKADVTNEAAAVAKKL
jgi:hypothetical protein